MTFDFFVFPASGTPVNSSTLTTSNGGPPLPSNHEDAPSCSTESSTPDTCFQSSSPCFPTFSAEERPSMHSQTSLHSPAKVSAPGFTWNPGTTETRLVNGSMRACCLGRGCLGKSGAPINANCSFKLCKPCCGKYQSEMNASCKEASHKSQTKTTSGTGMYVHSRPLLPQHYQRREQTQVDHHERTLLLQNRQVYADDIRRKIYIKFWDENGSSDIVTTECHTYPFFRLADCSVAVREAVGATEGRMVKTFDPKLKTWVLQESSNKQFLQEGEIVLIRARACQNGEGMKEAEEEEIHRRNPRKRKFECDDENTPHLRRTATIQSFPSPPPAPLICSPTPKPPVPPLRFSRAPSSSPDIPESRSTTPTPAPKKAKKAKVNEQTTPHANIDLSGSNSRHGNWPWKSYQRMHDGFIELDKTGGKHDDVFPKTSNKTRSAARAAWAAGSVALKAKFRKDPNGTWKNFVKEVRAAHGGTIPTHTDQKKKEKESQPSSLRVKQEVIELGLNPEEHEVIEIDSD